MDPFYNEKFAKNFYIYWWIIKYIKDSDFLLLKGLTKIDEIYRVVIEDTESH
jgi:hypothetical protein